MKEKIDSYLKVVSPKDEREFFVSLTYLALTFFETGNDAGIEYLVKDFYDEMISRGYGFSNPGSEFCPSVVEFGELVGFMLEDIQKIKEGKMTRDEARKADLWYLKHYIFGIKED